MNKRMQLLALNFHRLTVNQYLGFVRDRSDHHELADDDTSVDWLAGASISDDSFARNDGPTTRFEVRVETVKFDYGMGVVWFEHQVISDLSISQSESFTLRKHTGASHHSIAFPLSLIH